MKKVSVIVPIYNAGDYLKECLDALCAQTLQDMEIILVLDCPTDGSENIARSYATRDKRFVILENTTNLHIGNSRNRGLAFAQGEYIAFCDHDDVMASDMYYTLYNTAIKKNLDVILSLPAICSQEGTTIWEFPHYVDKDAKTSILEDLISWGNKSRAISHFCYIHNNLYRKELITNHNIHFVDTKETTPEDVIFNIETINAVDSVGIDYQNYYQHRMIDTSTGHQTAYQDWHKRYNGIQYVYNYLNTYQIYNQYKNFFFLYAQKQFLNGLLGILYQKKGFKEFFRAYKTIKSTSYCKEAFKQYHDDYLQQQVASKRLFRKFMAWTLSL